MSSKTWPDNSKTFGFQLIENRGNRTSQVVAVVSHYRMSNMKTVEHPWERSQILVVFELSGDTHSGT